MRHRRFQSIMGKLGLAAQNRVAKEARPQIVQILLHLDALSCQPSQGLLRFRIEGFGSHGRNLRVGHIAQTVSAGPGIECVEINGMVDLLQIFVLEKPIRPLPQQFRLLCSTRW